MYLSDASTKSDTQTTRNIPGRPLPYREAVEQTERKLFDEYTRACAGVRVLQMLRREAMSPLDRVHFWEKVIDWLPKIFELKRKLDEKVRAHEMSPEDAAANLAWQMRHVFPPGYALTNLESELAAARCALSKARWHFMVWQRTGRVPGERELLHGLSAVPAALPVPCPPPTCTPPAALLPSIHGFKFPNSFSVTIPLPSPLPPISGRFGLCGGMATAALDYFLSCIPIPSTVAVPIRGTPLFSYLFDRQLDSLGRSSLYDMVRKFISWTNRPDVRAGAGPLTIDGVQELTTPEFRATVASLVAGNPVVLGLIYVGPMALSIWDNHQVLAHAASSPRTGVTDLRIYDPNFPGDDSIAIRCEVLGARVRSTQIIPGGTMRVRGFFRMPYAKRIPPCLP